MAFLAWKKFTEMFARVMITHRTRIEESMEQVWRSESEMQVSIRFNQLYATRLFRSLDSE